MEFDIEDSEKIQQESIEKKETKPTVTQTVNMDEVKESKEVEIEIDFSDGNLLDDFEDIVETGDSKDNVEETTADNLLEESTGVEEKPKENLDSVKAEILVEESKGDFDLEDYEFASGVIVEGMAWGLGWILAYVAMDKDDEKYTPTDKRNLKLKEILTKVLIRANMKFSFMGAFCIMMLITYGTLGGKAVANRKKVKKKQDDEAEKTVKKIKGENSSRKDIDIESIPFEELVKEKVEKSEVVTNSEGEIIDQKLPTKTPASKALVVTPPVRRKRRK